MVPETDSSYLSCRVVKNGTEGNIPEVKVKIINASNILKNPINFNLCPCNGARILIYYVGCLKRR